MNRIELFKEEFIEENKDLALEVLAASSRMGIKLGWHYLLDLIWILKNINCPKGSIVLDAGAGNGLLQFMLTDRGYKVISADVFNRSIPKFASGLYEIKLMGDSGEISHSYWEGRSKGITYPKDSGNYITEYNSDCFDSSSEGNLPVILYYHCDLADMKELCDNSVDAVVSVSALEHNPPQKVKECIKDISRVLKPNASFYITISAVNKGESFHGPSHSWLLDEKGIMEAYELEEPLISNFGDFERVFDALCNSKYLKRWLASFYYSGENNGMPWGVWNPQYQPVGIIKTNNK